MFLCCVETSLLEDDVGSVCQIEDDSGFLRVKFFSLVGSQCSVREAF